MSPPTSDRRAAGTPRRDLRAVVPDSLRRRLPDGAGGMVTDPPSGSLEAGTAGVSSRPTRCRRPSRARPPTLSAGWTRSSSPAAGSIPPPPSPAGICCTDLLSAARRPLRICNPTSSVDIDAAINSIEDDRVQTNTAPADPSQLTPRRTRLCRHIARMRGVSLRLDSPVGTFLRQTHDRESAGPNEPIVGPCCRLSCG